MQKVHNQPNKHIIYRKGKFYIEQIGTGTSWPCQYLVRSTDNKFAYNPDPYWQLERAIEKITKLILEPTINKPIKHEFGTYTIKRSVTFPGKYDIYKDHNCIYRGSYDEQLFFNPLDWIALYEQKTRFFNHIINIQSKLNILVQTKEQNTL